MASVLVAPARGLGSAASFEVLGGSTVTNTGASVVAGDLGVAPGTTITGFPPGLVTDGGATHAGDALALQAQSDVALAYNSSAGQPCNTHLAGQELGGKTLTPDVYCLSSLAQLTGQLVLDAQGNAAAVWIIQIPGGLSTASNSSVVVTNGGGVCNVFWIVGESATIGASSSFAGNILALTSITLATGRQPVRSGLSAKWGGDAGYQHHLQSALQPGSHPDSNSGPYARHKCISHPDSRAGSDCGESPSRHPGHRG